MLIYYLFPIGQTFAIKWLNLRAAIIHHLHRSIYQRGSSEGAWPGWHIMVNVQAHEWYIQFYNLANQGSRQGFQAVWEDNLLIGWSSSTGWGLWPRAVQALLQLFRSIFQSTFANRSKSRTGFLDFWQATLLARHHKFCSNEWSSNEISSKNKS